MARRDTRHIFTISHTSAEIVTSASKILKKRPRPALSDARFVFEECIDRPLAHVHKVEINTKYVLRVECDLRSEIWRCECDISLFLVAFDFQQQREFP